MQIPPSPLAIIRSQRDSLAVAFHDLQVEHTLLKDSLRQTNELLDAARAGIDELESRLKSTGYLGSVEIASDADTDAAA